MHLSILSSSTLVDLAASFLAYPCVLVQMCETVWNHVNRGGTFDHNGHSKHHRSFLGERARQRRDRKLGEMHE